MRLAVTILAVVLMFVVAFAVFRNTGAPVGQPTQTEHQAAEAQKEAAPPPPGGPTAESVPVTPEAAQPEAPAAPPAETLTGLHILPAANPADRTLGSTDPDSPFKVELQLTRWGAAVERIALADYRENVEDKTQPYIVTKTLRAGGATAFPFAARVLEINGQRVPADAAKTLDQVAWSAGEVQTTDAGASVEYRITVADASDRPVAEVVRRYTVPAGSHDIRLDQQIVNRTDAPFQVEWKQFIQGDVTLDDAAYMGDLRKFVTGYFNPESDPERFTVWTDDAFLARTSLLSDKAIWPNPNLRGAPVLAWLASENRYFAVVTHPPVPTVPSGTDLKAADLTPLQDVFPRVTAVIFPANVEETFRSVVFAVETGARTVAPGAALELPLAIFAGPREAALFAEPVFNVLGFGQLIRYELGCTWCTFQWLAHGLLSFLTGLHFIVRDWGVAIIILVLIVRALLHPLTKKAQVGMMKVSKQMQALQPEIEKIRKKYGDDTAKVQAETMRLYREKGVNFGNMLGCLPMLLQTPIWIALYAMLYFAIELRHQPAFYGVFQHIGNALGFHWPFLADLSTADHFIPIFDEPYQINLFFIHLNFQAINILPLLMGVVFYLNMKFTSPPPPQAPPGGKLTEQQEMMAQQQKIMKIVFPIMMPFFLYSAPSGLTLYICASTLAGIVDSYIVRKHVREQEAAGKLFDTKPRNPNSLMAKLARVAEEKQRQMLERQQDMQRRKR